MEHATGTVPRLRALLHVQAQELEALGVRLLPVLAAVAVVVDVTGQIACDGLQLAVVKELGQVGVEVLNGGLARLDVDLHVADLDAHLFGVNDLNLDGLDIRRQVRKTSGLLKH